MSEKPQKKDTTESPSEVSFKFSYRALIATMVFILILLGILSPETITSFF